MFSLLFTKSLVPLTVFLTLRWTINPVVLIARHNELKLLEQKSDAPCVRNEVQEVRAGLAWPVVYHICWTNWMCNYIITLAEWINVGLSSRTKHKKNVTNYDKIHHHIEFHKYIFIWYWIMNFSCQNTY